MSTDTWLAALQERHRSPFTDGEFLKALRALSARYVERRATLAARSPLDSAGKRAAFAAFYAPMHFLTVREIVARLSDGGVPGSDRTPAIRTILDLGCGTGVASAAWALELPSTPAILGIDANAWAVGEAPWNWRQLGVHGRTHRSDLVTEAEGLLRRPRAPLHQTAIVAGWSVNELDPPARGRLLAAVEALVARGAALLIVEPIARSAVPWWDEWTARLQVAGVRADEWKFDRPLPAALAALDEAAGFRREGLSARSLYRVT